jgi:hypothetical protein
MTDWLFPYATLSSPVEVAVTGVTTDGGALPSNHILRDSLEVRLLDAENSEWQCAQLAIELSTAPDAVAEWEPPPAAYVVLNCGSSNARQTGFLSSEGEGKWRGTLEIDRSNWFGRLDLFGYLVAPSDGVPDRVIGSAPAWAIRLDDVPAPPIDGAIEMDWQNFADPKLSELEDILKPFSAEPTFLSLSTGKPVLYLNEAFEGLYALLEENPGSDPNQQALHDQVRSMIAIECWWGMWWAALHAINVDPITEELDGELAEWQRTAAEIAISYLDVDGSGDEALRNVAKSLANPGEAALTAEQLRRAATQRVGSATRLAKSIRLLSTNQMEDDDDE